MMRYPEPTTVTFFLLISIYIDHYYMQWYIRYIYTKNERIKNMNIYFFCVTCWPFRFMLSYFVSQRGFLPSENVMLLILYKLNQI